MKASQKDQISLQYPLSGLNNTLRGNRKSKINGLGELKFCIIFFQGNFSKLKASCDVNVTKGR